MTRPARARRPADPSVDRHQRVRTPRRIAATWAGVALVGVPPLAGCSQAVGIAAAPHATDPDCARVVLALPQTLGDDLERVRTSSQATAAWGSTEEAVTLRCGVEVPPPTTEQCVTVQTASGSGIDWLVQADAEPADAAPDPGASRSPGSSGARASDWTFVTYGRDPAVEVHVPADIAAERSTSFLDGLGTAIAQVEATRACL